MIYKKFFEKNKLTENTKRIFRPLTKSLSNCKGLLEAVIPNHLIRGDVLSKR